MGATPVETTGLLSVCSKAEPGLGNLAGGSGRPTEQATEETPMRRIVALTAALLASLFVAAPAALACGFLVSASGAVRLQKTTTFVAWEDGIERYITNFTFQGDVESFGSIIPLPAEPTDVTRAGDWTLQRLGLEVNPPPPLAFRAFAALGAEDGAQVVLRTRIDSLDVVVLKGGGADVLEWVNANGFNLPEGPETQHMLDFYGSRSPYFLAARFDASAAEDDGFISGDGIPVQITIPTDRPWVPLHILHGAVPDTDIIEADVFLLTPERPELLHGTGLTIERSEPARDLLLDDLRSDTNMEWVPESGWFTFLALDVEAQELVYDLSVGVDGRAPSFVDAGLTRFEPTDQQLADFGIPRATSRWPNIMALVFAGSLVGAVAGVGIVRTGSDSDTA